MYPKGAGMIPHPIPNGSPRQGVLWGEGPYPWAIPSEALSRSSDKLFFGLRLPAENADQAYRIGQDVRDAHGLHCRSIGRDRLHLSLFGFNSPRVVTQGVIDTLRWVGAAVVMPQFRIELNRTMSFGKKSDKQDRPFVLAGDDWTTSGIVMLRQQIICALRLAGSRAIISVSFNPHMTLFWGRHNLGEQPIEELGWTAQEFVLIHSYRGLGKHEVLGRWPLRATV
jgi:RNA 2',3'-cyclic 3'-phosphodiesterase